MISGRWSRMVSRHPSNDRPTNQGKPHLIHRPITGERLVFDLLSLLIAIFHWSMALKAVFRLGCDWSICYMNIIIAAIVMVQTQYNKFITDYNSIFCKIYVSKINYYE